MDRSPDRTHPVQSPEVAWPNGRFRSLREALASFEPVRSETTRLVEGFGDDPGFRLTDHPSIPGPVNGYEILLPIAIHPVRHARQIAEIRTALVP